MKEAPFVVIVMINASGCNCSLLSTAAVVSGDNKSVRPSQRCCSIFSVGGAYRIWWRKLRSSPSCTIHCDAIVNNNNNGSQ